MTKDRRLATLRSYADTWTDDAAGKRPTFPHLIHGVPQQSSLPPFCRSSPRVTSREKAPFFRFATCPVNSVISRRPYADEQSTLKPSAPRHPPHLSRGATLLIFAPPPTPLRPRPPAPRPRTPEHAIVKLGKNAPTHRRPLARIATDLALAGPRAGPRRRKK